MENANENNRDVLEAGFILNFIINYRHIINVKIESDFITFPDESHHERCAAAVDSSV